MFEELSNLPRPYRFSFTCSLLPEHSNEGFSVIDAKTNKQVKLILDPVSFATRLQLGDLSKVEWRSRVPSIINMYSQIYSKLETSIQKVSRFKLFFGVKDFITPEKVLDIAGKITSSLLFFNRVHLKKKTSGLPIGFYAFRGEKLDQSSVFINLKGVKPLGVGGGRKFKPCFELISGLFRSKGIWKGADKKERDREYAILRKMRKEPGVIHTYQAIINSDESYVVFQPYFKTNLEDVLIKSDSPLSDLDKEMIVEQLLNGLVAIAKHGTHFDIQAANILLNGKKGQMKAVITDFGIFHPPQHPVSLQFGTTFYPTPEWAKEGQLSPLYDVWRLGIVFYQLYTGKLPSNSDLRGEPLKKMLKGLKSGWLEMDKEFPPKMVKLIAKMVEPDPVKRFTAQQALNFFTTESKQSKN